MQNTNSFKTLILMTETGPMSILGEVSQEGLFYDVKNPCILTQIFNEDNDYPVTLMEDFSGKVARVGYSVSFDQMRVVGISEANPELEELYFDLVKSRKEQEESFLKELEAKKALKAKEESAKPSSGVVHLIGKKR